MITIGIVGTRRRDTKEDFEKTRQVFGQIWIPGDQICSGLCPQGSDWSAVLISLDKEWIEDKKERERLYQQVRNYKDIHYVIKPIWYPADWKKDGKIAGFLRNTDIAKTSNVLIATPSSDRTGGTEDTIKKFKKFHPEGRLILI